MNINWQKPGQVVNVGFVGNITSPYFHRSTINFYVDDKGNYFGCDSDPKFNPITGEKILEVNNIYAEFEYDEDYMEKHCCPYENRSMDGGCLNCGDPCL